MQLVERGNLSSLRDYHRRDLARIVESFASEGGVFATPIESLTVFRTDEPTQRLPAIYRPCICFIVQGSKRVWLGDESFLYDSLHYLVASVVLPVSGQVIDATPAQPYLGFKIDLSPAEVASLIADSSPPPSVGIAANRGLGVEPIDDALLDAVHRLLRLAEQPEDVPILAPLVLREILYRTLNGHQGHVLQGIAVADSQAHRINRAIEWLNGHYDQPLRIDALARLVNLSPSTLHHRFKSLTAMSPLQYQKQLRLQEARRLMLSDGLDAAAAGYRVGYESPSQFSREYSRQFGAPPRRDLARWRTSA